MTAHPPHPLRIDIGVNVVGVSTEVAVRCFPPDPEAVSRLPDPIWVFATHGSGADWRYWDIRVPGGRHPNYSFTEFFNKRGVGVVAIDILGVGDSVFTSSGALLDLETLATAHSQVAHQIRDRVSAGSITQGSAKVRDARWCGVGHSGGAGLTIVQQAISQSFDLIAPLGMPADDFEVLGGHDGVVSEMTVNERGMLQRSRTPTAEAELRSSSRANLDDVPAAVTARESLNRFLRASRP